MERLKGVAGSPGFAVGRALVLRQSTRDLRFRLGAERVEAEVARLVDARDRAREQLTAIKARVSSSAGPEHGYLFDAQLLMLDDPMLVGRALELVRHERLNAEWAVERAFDELSAILDAAEDPYLRERKGDMADVTGRLRGNLRGGADAPVQWLRALNGPQILVADELGPSLAAQVDWTQVAGFATDAGSWTYHTAILARSLHVPAVVGLHDASRRIVPGTTILIDGTAGEVIIDPPASLLAERRSQGEREAAYERSLHGLRDVPALTADGVAVRLDANVELPEDLPRALDYGAEGIGLYRSEFLLARRTGAGLTEDVQYETYRQMLETMAPRPVTIRTFDALDNQLEADASAGETRARFGLRGIRLGLRLPALFGAQLRALLRAAPHGRLRVMFPFVSGVEELHEARAALARARDELAARGIPVPDVPVGVMIEIPSAAVTADLIAREADFLSIGTNDLIQYCLAVDRTDDRVSDLYQPVHPSVLRMIRLVGRAGRRAGRPVSVCGEMASDAGLLALLIGLGMKEFSMNPAAIPVAKQLIRGLQAVKARAIAREALGLSTSAEVAALLERFSGGRDRMSALAGDRDAAEETRS